MPGPKLRSSISSCTLPPTPGSPYLYFTLIGICWAGLGVLPGRGHGLLLSPCIVKTWQLHCAPLLIQYRHISKVATVLFPLSCQLVRDALAPRTQFHLWPRASARWLRGYHFASHVHLENHGLKSRRVSSNQWPLSHCAIDISIQSSQLRTS